VVLSGINLGRWGRDPGKSEGMRLPGLLRRLIAETNIERIRLSSVEPMDWNDELLELMAESTRVAPHVHIPLQSGCDSVLKRMKRRYRARRYAVVEKARKLMPDAAIADNDRVSRETDTEFGKRAFIAGMPFTYLHATYRSAKRLRQLRRIRYRCRSARSEIESCASWPQNETCNSAVALLGGGSAWLLWRMGHPR
jgi:threonylcarbamoyladenosine tRNA methylthiotransferase MtaB